MTKTTQTVITTETESYEWRFVSREDGRWDRFSQTKFGVRMGFNYEGAVKVSGKVTAKKLLTAWTL